MSMHPHKDIEFAVSSGERPTQYFKKWEKAVALAFAFSASRGGEEAVIDVLVHSREGARHWLGDAGVEMYNEDPDASVFQRLSLRGRDLGRIP